MTLLIVALLCQEPIFYRMNGLDHRTHVWMSEKPRCGSLAMLALTGRRGFQVSPEPLPLGPMVGLPVVPDFSVPDGDLWWLCLARGEPRASSVPEDICVYGGQDPAPCHEE